MKKGMLVMAIVTALSFLVLVIAVAPAVAKQATQTPPTSKQQPQQGTVQTVLPKSVFWDLEVESITVKGQVIKKGSGNHTITVKVGEPVTFTCKYKAKTIPINNITKADAKFWGSGNHKFTIRLQVYFPTPNLDTDDLYKDKSLPSFTYEDIQNWIKRQKVIGGKSWSQEVVFQWTPKPQYVGIPYISVVYNLDFNHVIPEPDENNGYINTAGGLLYIVVTP
ncbi:MAG TPA: hypothetical protein VGB29_00545 [Thermodesulfobacteriota bacterium]|jgi:hypothetical protein